MSSARIHPFLAFCAAFVVLALTGAGSLAMRYELRANSGAIDPPALRHLADSDSTPFMGAEISDIPTGADTRAFQAALMASAPSLPWGRAVIRQAAERRAVFLPANSIGEAFALCSALATLPPRCAPQTALDIELRTPAGRPVNAATFARMGLAPYWPSTPRAKVAGLSAQPARG